MGLCVCVCWFVVCVCVCVCTCVCVYLCVCVYVYVCLCVCGGGVYLCVCVCAFMYMCMCVCVTLCDKQDVHTQALTTSSLWCVCAGLASCLKNVFLASRPISVEWGTYTVLEPEIVCMQDLWHHKA